MLTRWDPFSEMVSMREAIDRLFNESFVRPSGQWGTRGTVAPFPYDLYETGDEVVFRAGIPGVDPDRVELTVNQGMLTLKGDRTFHGDQDKQYTWHVRGLAEGSFQMAVSLPTAVDADQANASYENGILTIRLPKAEMVKARRIAVKGVQPHEALTAGTR